MGCDLSQFKGPVATELICSICTDVLVDPVQTPCEHLFCSQCINSWIPVEKSCPNCRRNCTYGQIKAIPLYLKTLIGNLDICCDFVCFGCEAVLKFDLLEGHLKDCPFNPQIDVTCGSCEAKYKKIDESSHCCVSHLKQVIKGYQELIDDFVTYQINDLTTIKSLEKEKADFEAKVIQMEKDFKDKEKRLNIALKVINNKAEVPSVASPAPSEAVATLAPNAASRLPITSTSWPLIEPTPSVFMAISGNAAQKFTSHQYYEDYRTPKQQPQQPLQYSQVVNRGGYSAGGGPILGSHDKNQGNRVPVGNAVYQNQGVPGVPLTGGPPGQGQGQAGAQNSGNPQLAQAQAQPQQAMPASVQSQAIPGPPGPGQQIPRFQHPVPYHRHPNAHRNQHYQNQRNHHQQPLISRQQIISNAGVDSRTWVRANFTLNRPYFSNKVQPHRKK